MNNIEHGKITKRAGLLESAVLKIFTRNAQISEIEDVGTAFRIVTISGDQLKGAIWAPGDKVQIQLGGWVQRTYTPLDWDAVSGQARILVFMHSNGPGVKWANELIIGQECIVFGPRKSTKITGHHAHIILIGDETSLGLAVALSNHTFVRRVLGLFEIKDLGAVMPALKRLRLDDSRLFVSSEDSEHLSDVEKSLSTFLRAYREADIILTGRAGLIQHVKRFLRQEGVQASRMQSKAYWALGKTGLD